MGGKTQLKSLQALHYTFCNFTVFGMFTLYSICISLRGSDDTIHVCTNSHSHKHYRTKGQIVSTVTIFLNQYSLYLGFFMVKVKQKFAQLNIM